MKRKAIINKVNEESKLSKVLGKHTDSVIMGILYFCTLMCLVLICIFVNKLPETVVTGFFTILGGAITYFTSSLKKNK